MIPLDFEIVQRPHSATETVAFVRHTNGQLRRASAEEERLWEALQEALKARSDDRGGKRR